MERVFGKIKIMPEDFVVEEIRQEGVCKISDVKKFGTVTDVSQLGVNESREFVICDLEKFDIDSFRAIRELASFLHKGIDAIGIAGTKDKKAWTCQKISIFKPDLELLKKFKHSNIYLKNFSWGKRKIKMGFLEGNMFKVVLRDVNKKDAIKVSSVISKLDFFPNYFGEQRFGSVRKNNFKIGLLILKRRFEEAVWEILTDINGNEQEETIKARLRLKKEKNIKDAIEYFPSYLGFEKRILNYLNEHPEDFIGALKRAERKNVLMFVHAVQSKIFNEILEVAMEQNFDFKRKGQQRIPLFGYKSRIDEGELGDIELNVLKNNKLELEDFDIKEIPFLRIKGDLRNAIVEIKNLSCNVSNDELFEGSKKIILSFELPKGVYATTFIGVFFEVVS